jgi:hypothetical protein
MVVEHLKAAAWRIVEWWDLTFGHARHAPEVDDAVTPLDDRQLAAAASLELLERFKAKLATLTEDEADAWSRAIVEEHACGAPSDVRYSLYESLVELARVKRQRRA